MLKFLENRKDEFAPKKTIREKPYIAFGISLQTPETFQKPWTMINKSTYVNPYVPLQDRREVIPTKKRLEINPSWTKRINLNLVQQQKIISNTLEVPNNYRSSYQTQYKKDKSRFRITKGEFKSFIERGSRYKSIAPVDGNERNNERALQTKRSVIQKSLQTIQKSTKSRLTNVDSLGKLSISSRNSPLSLKIQLRRTRQTFYNEQKILLDLRKKTKQESFVLPEVAKSIKRRYIYNNYDNERVENMMHTIEKQLAEP